MPPGTPVKPLAGCRALPMPVTKAVIPAAGFGTRFLPATKSQPKEMLPVVDTPAIQYVVEECVESGITDILIVIGRGKQAIEEHFCRAPELEAQLEEKGQTELLHEIRTISDMASIQFAWQKQPDGLGDAVSYGQDFAGGDPFALLLGDTIISSNNPGNPILRQMIEIFEARQASVVALEEVDPHKVSRYGIAGGDEEGEGIISLNQLIEKPSPEEAPSNLAIAARYVFQPEIFNYISMTPRGKNNEVQLTDAMVSLLQNHGMYGLRLSGKRHDIGNKLDFIKANVALGLQSTDISSELAAYLHKTVSEL